MSAAPEKPKLGTDNTKSFWESAWSSGSTGWKAGEKGDPFTRVTFALLVYLLRGAPGAPDIVKRYPLPQIISAELNENPKHLAGEEEEALVREKLAGRTVMVPLCGDTRAVPYMAHQGASVVIGADLCAKSLRLQREVNFPGVSFACREETVAGETVKVYEAELEGSGNTRVILFEGDFLSLRECPAFQQRVAGKVDLVYDRASFMAINPALRTRYVEVIAAALKTPEQSKAEGVLHAGVAIERPVRREGDLSGPPFFFSADVVETLYSDVLGRMPHVTQIMVDAWRCPQVPAENVPLYFDWFGVY